MEPNPSRFHNNDRHNTVQNPFATLPMPILAEVVGNLNANAIANTERSCKMLWKSLNNDEFFHVLCLRFPEHKEIKNSTTTWKQVYIGLFFVEMRSNSQRC